MRLDQRDRATAGFEQRAGDGEAQAGAALPAAGGEEGFEQARGVGGRDAGPSSWMVRTTCVAPTEASMRTAWAPACRALSNSVASAVSIVVAGSATGGIGPGATSTAKLAPRTASAARAIRRPDRRRARPVRSCRRGRGRAGASSAASAAAHRHRHWRGSGCGRPRPCRDGRGAARSRRGCRRAAS